MPKPVRQTRFTTEHRDAYLVTVASFTKTRVHIPVVVYGVYSSKPYECRCVVLLPWGAEYVARTGQEGTEDLNWKDNGLPVNGHQVSRAASALHTAYEKAGRSRPALRRQFET